MEVPLGGFFLGGGGATPDNGDSSGTTPSTTSASSLGGLLEDLELHIMFFLDRRSLSSLACTCRHLHHKDLPSCVLGLHLWKVADKSNLPWLTCRMTSAGKPPLRFLQSLHITLDGKDLEDSATCLGQALLADHMPHLELLDLCLNRYNRPRVGGVDPTVAVKETTPGVPELLRGIAHVLQKGRITSLHLYKLDLREGGSFGDFDLHHLRVLDLQFCHMTYGCFLPCLLSADSPRALNPSVLQVLRLPFVFELSPVTDQNIDSLLHRLKQLGPKGLPCLELLDFTAIRSGQWFNLTSPWEDLRSLFSPDKVVEHFQKDHSHRVYRGLEF